MKPTLLILAAGMGSRYGGLKQIDEIGPHGETLLEYSLYDAIQAGFGKVVFVIRKDIEAAFEEKIGGKFEGKIKVEYAFQETNTPVKGITSFPAREKPWGTAHAVLVAHDKIKEPFAVINSDDYYGSSAFHSIAEFLVKECSPTHYAMVGYVLENTLSDHGTVNRGICEMDEDNYLTDVVERLKIQRADGQVFYRDDNGNPQPLSEKSLVSMNYWGFHPNIFEIIRAQFVDFVAQNRDNPKAEFLIPSVVNDLIKEGRIRLTVLPNDEQWYGVTYREDRDIVRDAFKDLIENGKYPTPLWD